MLIRPAFDAISHRDLAGMARTGGSRRAPSYRDLE